MREYWIKLRDMDFDEITQTDLFSERCPACLGPDPCPISDMDALERTIEAFYRKNIWAFRQACQEIIESLRYKVGDEIMVSGVPHILIHRPKKFYCLMNKKTKICRSAFRWCDDGLNKTFIKRLKK